MARFFVESVPDPQHAPRIALPRAEAHHALRARRLADGDAVEVFDGTGRAATGVLRPAGREAAVELAALRVTPEPRPALDVAVALPKASRAEHLIDQLSQLGADRVLPAETARASVKPRDGKRQRFRRIAVEAAKQCGRDRLLAVADPAPLAAWLEGDHDLRLIAAAGASAPASLPESVRGAKRVLVAIGPEGGFRDDELRAAEDAGARRWPLGPLTMRVETAAAAAAALIRYWAPG